MTSNPQKRKVMVASLNRSEYSRIRSVIKALLERDDVETVIAVLDSKYTNTSSIFKNDDVPIHHRVFISINERKNVKTSLAISEITEAFAKIFDKERPDVLVVIGDRYEALGVVVAAVFQNLFIAHIQGGEVTGTHDEHTRHAITKLSHLHFPATVLSGERIIKMGENPEMVIVVGCPGTDLVLESPNLSFEEFKYEIYKLTKRTDILEKLEKDFFLVMQFPVPTEGESAALKIKETLEAIKKFPNSKLILTPIPDAGGDIVEAEIRKYAEQDQRAIILKHLPPSLFTNAMRHASVMIGNSSAGIRETGYLGVPTVNIGSRQDGRERSSNIIDAPYNTEAIVEAIKKQINHGKYSKETIYGTGGTGKKIADIIAAVDCSKIQKKLNY